VIVKLNGVPWASVYGDGTNGNPINWSQGLQHHIDICTGHGAIVQSACELDKSVQFWMNQTAVTKGAYEYATSLADSVGDTVAIAGKYATFGVWNGLDDLGAWAYTKALPGIFQAGHDVLHTVVSETIKNCTAGTGCF
jgi:hypothetical protein